MRSEKGVATRTGKKEDSEPGENKQRGCHRIVPPGGFKQKTMCLAGIIRSSIGEKMWGK